MGGCPGSRRLVSVLRNGQSQRRSRTRRKALSTFCITSTIVERFAQPTGLNVRRKSTGWRRQVPSHLSGRVRRGAAATHRGAGEPQTAGFSGEGPPPLGGGGSGWEVLAVGVPLGEVAPLSPGGGAPRVS